MRSRAPFVAATVLASVSFAFAGVSVPAGFAVDQLSPQLDNISPRLEAIRNPAYGNGVMAASISGDILTVRRISQGNVEPFAVASGFTGYYVTELRFDGSGLFGGELYIVAAALGVGTGVSRFLRFDPTGAMTPFGSIGSASDELAMSFDFGSGTGGYTAGAYLYDSNGTHGSSVWTLTPPSTFTRLAQNSVVAGRSDMDVNGIEFDPTGAFGGSLFLSEADINQSGLGAVFRLSPALVWTAFTPQMNFTTRHFRDLAISPGGALGNFIYVTEAVGDAIGRIATDAGYSVFASGLSILSEYDNTPGGEGAASLSISADGNTLYFSDANGVYRIRLVGNVPGPQVITQEPSAPSDSSICGPSALPSMRIFFNEPVQFVPADVVVTNGGVVVPSVISGSGSSIMLIAFGTPLFDDTYTITLNDTITSIATGAQLDGDRNGIAGADAVLTLTHMSSAGCCEGDANLDGVVNFPDITSVLQNWLEICP